MRKFPFHTIANLLAGLRVQLVLLLTIGVLFVLLSLVQSGIVSMSDELLLGCILSVTNAFLGYSFLEKAFRFNNNLFLVVSLAGMALRFFLMIASIAVILVMTSTGIGLFIGSFMVTYTIFMMMEVYHINRKTDQLRAARVHAR